MRTKYIRESIMWYFSWVLGVSLACTFGVLNAMWFEIKESQK